MTVTSVKEKLQRGKRILGKAGNDPDLLSPALTAIHGAMEDACRMWLAAPEIRRQHGIDVLNNSKASWKVLLELMPRYCGWSSQDVRRVSRMNYLRNQTAHGGAYLGTRREIEEYFNFIERAIARSNGQSYNNNRQNNRNYRRNTKAAYQSTPLEKYLADKFSFPVFWMCLTFVGIIMGIFVYGTLHEALKLPMTSNGEEISIKVVLEMFVAYTGIGLGVGFLQARLLEKKMADSWLWIVATLIGYVSPIIPLYLVSLIGLDWVFRLVLLQTHIIPQLYPEIGYVILMIILAIYGAIIGYWQYLVLRS